MQKKSRAEQIAQEILQSERYANTRAFEDRIYRDEPIIRTGAQAFLRQGDKGTQGDAGYRRPPLQPLTNLDPLPTIYRKMRAIARRAHRPGGDYSRGATGTRLFYEQGKLMESFEEDFAGTTTFERYFPSYEMMSNYQLRCYFSWRTKYRKGEIPDAPVSFLFVLAYELLCGIGVKPGAEGYEALCDLAYDYAGTSPSFDSYMVRWTHDYIIYHGLDASLLPKTNASFPFAAVALLRKAECVLLAHDSNAAWPLEAVEGMPSEVDLLDALCELSRYRAENSFYVKRHREDVAQVAAYVFAHMVAHCHKRRKTDYVVGLFGTPAQIPYTMFASACFWETEPHKDVRYQSSDYEAFVCQSGFWFRELSCRRMEKRKEIGLLLHAIDARMRLATGEKRLLKERPLPMYQSKFVDEGISALLARKEAEEAARIHIDRSSLGNIRSASVRTREALLTDEEREDDEATASEVLQADNVTSGAQPGEGLSIPHADLLLALLNDGPLPQVDSMYLTLVVDEINDALLDVVGDTVIEFDGDRPMFVEDYVDDVREALELDGE